MLPAIKIGGQVFGCLSEIKSSGDEDFLVDDHYFVMRDGMAA